MDEQRTSKLLLIPALGIGLVFILIGVARPSFFWDSGKVVQGREWFGDGGMSAVFILFGLVFCAAILGRALKRKQ